MAFFLYSCSLTEYLIIRKWMSKLLIPVVWYVYVVCGAYLMLLVSREYTQEYMHASTHLRLHGISWNDGMEFLWETLHTGFLWPEGEEEEEMMKRRKLRIITIIFFSFFLNYCWSNFPSLLYPVCLSVAQKSKKSKISASTFIQSPFKLTVHLFHLSPSFPLLLCLSSIFSLYSLFFSLLIAFNPSIYPLYLSTLHPPPLAL